MINNQRENSIASAYALHKEFQALTGCLWSLPEDMEQALSAVFAQLGQEALKPAQERRAELQAAINSKLKLSQPAYKNILDMAAANGVTFNYHEKLEVLHSLDYNDRVGFFAVMVRKNVPPQVLSTVARHFTPSSWHRTIYAFSSAVHEDEKASQVQRAVFSAFAFHSFKSSLIHSHFSGTSPDHYYPRYYDHLRFLLPQVFRRPCGLTFWKIDDDWLAGGAGEEETREKTLETLERLSERLSNHCYFGILIKPLRQGEAFKWRLYSDLVLFGEKHRDVKLRAGYFHPERVAAQTHAYIPTLDMAACRFDLAQEGLYYKDCFVINYNARTPQQPQQEPDLLVLFEKSERDETLIPCPACRSSIVQGNSYPVLGVRSWECKNPLCPERSKYDRGNRYSLASLLKQEAIEEVEATIPLPSLRLWKRDVVNLPSEDSILTMLVQHYSLLDDKVMLVNLPVRDSKTLGRRLFTEAPEPHDGEANINSTTSRKTNNFFGGPYFSRICVPRPAKPVDTFSSMSGMKGVEVYCGDCFDVLRRIGDNSVDGVVTSPPYYNAREYASWPNIYGFLYDQFNVAGELHRVLKPGGLFFYNIFDYFDNENNIVFSAMGNKRMILGAYAINLFERAGFSLVKNVVWDKGEIEGKRNFNQGNQSPYYQAPFNCWEHILVFSKGSPSTTLEKLPFVLRAQPVVKMVGGKNILGHTAPYPKAIPDLLLDSLEPRSTVLDPYAGSMTTARAAYKRGMRSINIDYKEEYCKLGISLLVEQEMNLLDGMGRSD